MRNLLSIILLLVLSFAVHIRWLPEGIFTYGDWMFQYAESLVDRFTLPQLWVSLYSPGHVWLQVSSWPVVYSYGWLGSLGYNSSFAGVFFYFLPIIVLAPIGIYLLLSLFFNSKIAVIVGSITFLFNTYFLHLQTSFLTLAVANSLVPLVLFLFIRSIKERNYTYALLAGLVSFIMSIYEFRGFYILTFVLFLYYLVNVVSNRKHWKQISLIAFLPLLIVFLLNIYWIIAYLNIGVLTSNAAFDRPLFGNEFLNINYAFTMLHPFWTGEKPAVFEAQHIPLYAWIIPSAAFIGLYLNKKNKDILFFGIIALLGIFLTKQVGSPFSSVYPFLYENFPGFNAFREASKFFILILIGYSVLIAGFIDWLWRNWRNKRTHLMVTYIIIISLVSIFLINTKPLLTGEVNTLFVERTPHDDYHIVKENILKENAYFRTLWIPIASRWSIYTLNHPHLSFDRLKNSNWKDYLTVERENPEVTSGELMKALTEKPYFEQLLSLHGIRYVFVPVRDIENNDDFFIHYGGFDRSYYINMLDNLDGFERRELGTKEIIAYENQNYRPHIYITQKEETVTENIFYEEAEYEAINSTQYRVVLSDMAEPVYLNFSESYHPQWKVRVGEFHWYDVLIQENYFISGENHFKNDVQLNSFLIDPEQVCQEFVCTKNSDGSYDIELTIYFKPQSYIYLGLIISLTTLVGILIYFVNVVGKRFYEKN